MKGVIKNKMHHYYNFSKSLRVMDWISTKIKQPEESDEYIVTIKSRPERKPYTDVALYNAATKQWEDEPSNEYDLITDITNEVIAWMPMPTPLEED